MSDTYQAIYDAACRRIQGGNVSDAIESALRDAFGSAHSIMASVAQYYSAAAEELARPSVVYRPTISIDGDQWSALYGDNLQEGVAGFGASPAEAMADFDKNWFAKLKAGGTKVCGDELEAALQQQGEAVAKVCHAFPQHIGWSPEVDVTSLAEGTPLFTHPPKPVVSDAWPNGVLNRKKTIEVITEHNAWRRGAEGAQTDPRMLGLALDAVIAALGVTS